MKKLKQINELTANLDITGNISADLKAYRFFYEWEALPAYFFVAVV